MTTYTITVTNNAVGCNNEIEQQISVSGCSTYIVRLTSNSNALGPFNVYLDSTIYYSAQTRNEMLDGAVVTIECGTPTPTPTPTITPTNQTPTPTPTNTLTPGLSATPTVTPTNTTTPAVTPTPTPSSAAFMAYIFAEPQDLASDTTLLAYASANGTLEWYSYYSVASPPNNSGGSYSNDLNVYAHQPSFVSGGSNFVTPVTFSAPIAQTPGQIINGFAQNIYTYGSIQVNSTVVNPSLQYFYSIWVPLAGVGGSISDMTNDVGTSAGGQDIYASVGTVVGLTSLNVTVTSGAAIPAGTYRVLWVSPQYTLPGGVPLTGSLYFRGENKI
jgi:hypothetical protein